METQTDSSSQPRPLQITAFGSVTETKPIPQSMSWDELREDLSSHKEVESKEGVALICPASFHEGTSRAKANVDQVSLAVLDVDDGMALEDAEQRIRAAGHEALVYTSHSHTTKHPRFRVVMPLAEPIPGHLWPQAYPRVAALLDGHADPKCSDASRIYYVPSCPPGAAHQVIHIPGKPWALQEGLNLSQAPEPRPAQELARGADVPLDELREWAALGLKDPDSLEVLRGGKFPEGKRTRTFYEVASKLVFAVGDAVSVDSAKELFRASAEASETPDNTVDQILWQVCRSLESARRDWAGKQPRRPTIVRPSEARALQASLLRRLDEEKRPFSDQEIAALAAAEGCSVEELPRRWVIQHGGKAHYVLTPDGYLPPITSEALRYSLPRDLARASLRRGEERPLVALRYPSDPEHPERVPDKRPVPEILDDHCTVARRAMASFVAARSHYEPRTQLFTEAVAPLRKFTPREHPEIHEWLRLLGGDRAEKFLDWVATVTQLERQTCAVYLVGQKGAGKSVFAEALAKLWTTGGPTPARDVLTGNFNDSLAGCPLIFADEALPRKAGQRQSSADLRELIGSSNRKLQRKFLPSVDLIGAVRLVMAANNDRLLDLGEDLDAADQAAVAERFLVIRVADEATDYLAARRDKIPMWIERGIAEHALWLKENREVAPAERFLVNGDAEALTTRLALQGPGTMDTLAWIIRCIRNGGRSVAARLGQGEDPPIYWGGGQVWANSSTIHRHWTAYDPELRSRPGNVNRTGRILKQLAKDPSETETTRKLWAGKRRPVRELDPELLYAAADELTEDVDDLRAIIEGSLGPSEKAQAERPAFGTKLVAVGN